MSPTARTCKKGIKRDITCIRILLLSLTSRNVEIYDMHSAVFPFIEILDLTLELMDFISFLEMNLIFMKMVDFVSLRFFVEVK